tara:strand:- start:7692 stop:8522 length:831 start_codon:yes stop_codon:yes gene_type:complete
MDFKATDVDGNTVEMDDQGGVLDAPHSQESQEATEQEAVPRAPEADPTKSPIEAKETIDYQKSYKELERTYQRQQQEYTRLKKEHDESYVPYKDKLQSWQKADELLSRDPVALQYLQARQQGFSHQDSQQLAEQSQNNPHLNAMLNKVNNLESYVSKVQEKEQQTQTNNYLDNQESKANDVFKDFFGKEMGQQDKAEMYKWMSDRNIYDGEAAINALHAKKYAESYAQKVLQEQKAKGTKGIQRTDTRNSSSAKAPSKAMSLRDAIESSYRELQGE